MKRRGRCLLCRRIFNLRKDHTIFGHGGRPPYPQCAGSQQFPWFEVGDVVASTLNDTTGLVEQIKGFRATRVGGWRQGLLVRKLSGERGWAKIGEIFIESNTQAFLVEAHP